jgi:hypothetical protein
MHVTSGYGTIRPFDKKCTLLVLDTREPPPRRSKRISIAIPQLILRRAVRQHHGRTHLEQELLWYDDEVGPDEEDRESKVNSMRLRMQTDESRPKPT